MRDKSVAHPGRIVAVDETTREALRPAGEE
jgi:hypothetical protein